MLQNCGFTTFALAQEGVRRAIENYNPLRQHGSCNYHAPESAHQTEGELAKSGGGKSPAMVKTYNRVLVYLSSKTSPKSVKLFQGDTQMK